MVVIIVVLFATYIQRHRRRQELMEMRIEHLQQLKKDFAKTNAEEIKRAEQTIESSNIWQRLATLPDHEHPTDDDWQQLAEAVDEAYEGFTCSSGVYHGCLTTFFKHSHNSSICCCVV